MDIYNIPTRLIGMTSEKIEFEFTDETTGLKVDLTGVTALCQFRFGSKCGNLQAELTIGSGLTVPTPTNGIIEIDEIDEFDWSKGVYYYDIKLTFTDDTDAIWIGGTMPTEITTTKS